MLFSFFFLVQFSLAQVVHYSLALTVLIKILLYTGVRVGELVKIKMEDVYLNKCQIKIKDGKGHKDRVLPFPSIKRQLS